MLPPVVSALIAFVITLFWTWLAWLWPGWYGALAFVEPRTIIAWQRERFRCYSKANG
jgi:hypothetical protein